MSNAQAWAIAGHFWRLCRQMPFLQRFAQLYATRSAKSMDQSINQWNSRMRDWHNCHECTNKSSIWGPDVPCAQSWSLTMWRFRHVHCDADCKASSSEAISKVFGSIESNGKVEVSKKKGVQHGVQQNTEILRTKNVENQSHFAVMCRVSNAGATRCVKMFSTFVCTSHVEKWDFWRCFVASLLCKSLGREWVVWKWQPTPPSAKRIHVVFKCFQKLKKSVTLDECGRITAAVQKIQYCMRYAIFTSFTTCSKDAKELWWKQGVMHVGLTSCRLATRNRRQDFVQLASREACFKPFLRCLCALHVCSWRTSEKPAESHEPRDCWHTATFGVSKMSNHRLRSFPLPHASLFDTSRDVPCHEFESGRHAASNTAVLHFAEDSSIVMHSLVSLVLSWQEVSLDREGSACRAIQNCAFDSVCRGYALYTDLYNGFQIPCWEALWTFKHP